MQTVLDFYGWSLGKLISFIRNDCIDLYNHKNLWMLLVAFWQYDFCRYFTCSLNKIDWWNSAITKVQTNMILVTMKWSISVEITILRISHAPSSSVATTQTVWLTDNSLKQTGSTSSLKIAIIFRPWVTFNKEPMSRTS